jgi:hypothetical protein
VNERLNPAAIKESKALAQCPHLATIAMGKLAEMDSLPDSDTPEANALSDSLKTVRYALISQIIEGMLDGPEEDEPIVMNPSSASFKRAAELIRQKYNRRLMTYSQTGGDEIIKVLQAHMDKKILLQPRGWNDAFGAVEGGIGTMATANGSLLEVFAKYLKTQDLTLDERILALRRSYGPLIEIALHDALQLMALFDSMTEGVYPNVQYNKQAHKVEFSTGLFDQELSSTTIMHLSIYEDLPPQRPLTVSDVSNDHTVIGCPVLFKPGQIQALWNETIDIAASGGLL